MDNQQTKNTAASQECTLTITTTDIPVIVRQVRPCLACDYCSIPFSAPQLIYQHNDNDKFYHRFCLIRFIKDHNRRLNADFLVDIEENPGMEFDDTVVIMPKAPDVCSSCDFDFPYHQKTCKYAEKAPVEINKQYRPCFTCNKEFFGDPNRLNCHSCDSKPETKSCEICGKSHNASPNRANVCAKCRDQKPAEPEIKAQPASDALAAPVPEAKAPQTGSNTATRADPVAAGKKPVAKAAPKVSKQTAPKMCKYDSKKGGCTNNQCKFDHSPKIPTSHDPKVKAALKDEEQKEKGDRDAARQIERELKQQEQDAKEARLKQKKKNRKYDSSFFKRGIGAPQSFMHMVDGPRGVTNPNLAFFIAIFFILAETMWIYLFEHAMVGMAKILFGRALTTLPTIHDMIMNSTISTYADLTSDILTLINLILVLRSLIGLVYKLFFCEYELTNFIKLSIIGRLLADHIYNFVGVCDNNSFIIYEWAGSDQGSRIESRMQNRRDPDVRIPTDYDQWKVRRGNLCWPINKRPPMFYSVRLWDTAQGHGPKLNRSPTIISYDVKVSFTAHEELLDKHPLLHNGAFMTDSTEFRTSRTLLVSLLSPRNVSRQLTFAQASTFIQRDASSINTINVDSRMTMQLHNVIANTTHLALAWLLYDRQQCQIFTDNVATDFRLHPQH